MNRYSAGKRTVKKAALGLVGSLVYSVDASSAHACRSGSKSHSDSYQSRPRARTSARAKNPGSFSREPEISGCCNRFLKSVVVPHYIAPISRQKRSMPGVRAGFEAIAAAED